MTFNSIQAKMENGLVRQIVIGILIAFCSGSVGFGISQASIVATVATNKTDIGYLKADREQIRKDFQEERSHTDERIKDVTDLVKRSIELDQQLIDLVKVQNELLTRKK